MKKKTVAAPVLSIIFLLTCFLLLTILSGCNPASTTTAEESSPPENTVTVSVEPPEESAEPVDQSALWIESLTYEDFLADYDFFWETIEECYPFLGVAERSGIDVNAIREENRSKISEKTTFASFAKLMKSMISQFDSIGHISLIDTDFYEYILSAYRFSMNNGTNAQYSHLYNQITDSKTLAAYRYLNPKLELSEEYQAAVEFSESPTTASIFSASTGGGAVTTEILEDGQIAYVRISSFGRELIDASSEALQQFFVEISNYSDIIIDIRGNGGGSTNGWQINVLGPLLNEPLSCSLIMMYNDAPLVKDYIDTMGIFELSIPFEDFREMQSFASEDSAYLSHVHESQATFDVNKDMQVGFSGKIWLLVDGKVYSAAEEFAVMCKATGFATIVGRSTGGDGIGTDPLLFKLPNTGLLWRSSIFYGVNPDGSNNEEFGTTPDILLERGEDALLVALSEIAKARQ